MRDDTVSFMLVLGFIVEKMFCEVMKQRYSKHLGYHCFTKCFRVARSLESPTTHSHSKDNKILRPPKVIMTPIMKKSELANLLNVSTSAIEKYCAKHKIRITSKQYQDKYHDYINNFDLDSIKKELSKNKKCAMCGCSFLAKTIREKYCSSKCRTKKNKLDFKNKKTSRPSQSYNMKKTISDKKMMKDCTVDCLLEEFGDIE